MSLIDILLTIVLIAAFCLGLRTLMSDGQIFHSIRAPHAKRKYAKWYDVILKPLILCVVCFSSVWGGAVFVALHGLHLTTVPELIICCVSSTFIIKVINDKVDW